MSSKWMKKEERLGHIGGKVCIYGTESTGKSMGAGTFPRINLIDAEDGNTFYLEDNDNILQVLPTSSASEVQEAMEELENPDMIEDYDTLIIDSGTKIYENMQAAAYEIVESRAKKMINKGKGKDIDLDDLNLSPRDWGHIKRWNQRLQTSYISMSNAGKWAIVTAHEKDITEEIGEGLKKKTIVIGNRPDLAKKAEHDFDIVIRTFKKQDPITKEMSYWIEIKKDRTNVTKEGQQIDMTGRKLFDIWKDKWESTKKLGVKKVNMKNDVEKSVSKMEIEDNTLEKLTETFKVKMELVKENEDLLIKVQAKLKELKITNPLRSTDLEGMEKLIEFMNSLQ